MPDEPVSGDRVIVDADVLGDYLLSQAAAFASPRAQALVARCGRLVTSPKLTDETFGALSRRSIRAPRAAVQALSTVTEWR